MANSPDTVATIFAVALAGAVVRPDQHPLPRGRAALRGRRRRREHDRHQRSDRRLRGPLRAAERGARSLAATRPGAAARDLPRRRRRRPGALDRGRVAGGGGAGRPAAELEHRRVAVRVRDDALLLYTSGTTALRAAAGSRTRRSCATGRCVPQILRLGAGDRMWAPCPLFHLGAIGPLVACASAAARRSSRTRSSSPSARSPSSPASGPPTSIPPTRRSPRRCWRPPGFAEADLSRARVMLNVAPAGPAARDAGGDPARRPGLALRLDRGRRRDHLQQLDDDLETRVTHLRAAAARLRGAHRRSGDRRGRCRRRCRARSSCAAFGLFEAYLQRPGEDRGRLRRGRLVPHRRPRFARRVRPAAVPRAPEGHAQGRRRERRARPRSSRC